MAERSYADPAQDGADPRSILDTLGFDSRTGSYPKQVHRYQIQRPDGTIVTESRIAGDVEEAKRLSKDSKDQNKNGDTVSYHIGDTSIADVTYPSGSWASGSLGADSHTMSGLGTWVTGDETMDPVLEVDEEDLEGQFDPEAGPANTQQHSAAPSSNKSRKRKHKKKGPK